MMAEEMNERAREHAEVAREPARRKPCSASFRSAPFNLARGQRVAVALVALIVQEPDCPGVPRMLCQPQDFGLSVVHIAIFAACPRSSSLLARVRARTLHPAQDLLPQAEG